MGVVRAICKSVRRGTQKEYMDQAHFIEDFGIEGDAHAGKWHRQISLLGYEVISDFNQRGAGVEDGAFGENMVIEGIDLTSLPIGTIFTCGEVRLQLTQIGKECHKHCAIYYKMDDCIMPTNGIFAKVLSGGNIKVGDTITYELPQSIADHDLAATETLG